PQTLDRAAAADRDVAAVDPQLIDEVVAQLTEAHSAFGRAEIAKLLIPATPAGLDRAEAVRAWQETATDAVLAHPQVVTLACPLLSETPAGLRRADGMATAERHGQRRWTT